MSKAIFLILSILLIAGLFLEEAEAQSRGYYGGRREYGGGRGGYNRGGYNRGGYNRGGYNRGGYGNGYGGYRRGRSAVENDDVPLTFIGTPVDGFE